MGDPGAPSGFFVEQLPALRRAAGGAAVADLACGRGRHALAAAEAGCAVLGVDRSAGALGELCERARRGGLPVCGLRADLEGPFGIPVAPGACSAVLVFRFLFRPLAGEIERVLAPGGLLLYETFTEAQAGLPHGPSNPAFLLRSGELPALFPGLEVLDYREERVAEPWPQALARLAARKRT